MNVFADLRAKYFAITRPNDFPAPSSSSEPWGAIMEISYPQAVVTTVAFSDGTASVLRSSGGGFFGGGDSGVQSAAREFLAQAGSIRAEAAQIHEFLEPGVGHVAFYARTDSGVYGVSVIERVITQQHPLFPALCAGMRILHEYLRLQRETDGKKG